MTDRPATQPAAQTRPPRSLDRIIFDLVLVAFLAVFVYVALDLRPDSRLVPLIVGVPTLAAMLVRTILDVLARGADYRSTSTQEVVSTGEPDQDTNPLASASTTQLAHAAQEEVAADNAPPTDPTAQRRQRAFALWCLTFVLAAMAATEWLRPLFGLHTYFLPASVAALLVIFRAIGVRWRANVAITGVVIVFMYYMLVTFLNVRL